MYCMTNVLHDIIQYILSYNNQQALKPLEVFSPMFHREKDLGEFVILITYSQSNYPLSRDSWAKPAD